MSLTSKEAESKCKLRKQGFKKNNRYAAMKCRDNKAFDVALEDTRKALKWMEENPGKALPLGY